MDLGLKLLSEIKLNESRVGTSVMFSTKIDRHYVFCENRTSFCG